MALVFVSWFSLVVTSILSEMHSQWGPTSQKYATQRHWIEDCKNPSHWARYPEECLKNAGTSHPSFFTQWIDAVVRNVKWCGVDQCEELLTPKTAALIVVVYMLFGPAPRLVRRGWKRVHNA